MNRFALVAAATLMVTTFLVSETAPAAQVSGIISGYGSVDGKPVRNATAVLREIPSGQLAASTACDNSGIFAFVGVPAGTYVVELVCSGGALMGTSAPVTLVGSAMAAPGVSVDVNGPAASA